MLLEKDIERHLKKRVESIGGKCLKFVCPGHSGVPDRIVLLPHGFAAFVELKAPGKRPRPLQSKWLFELSDMGFPVYCIDSKEEVDLFIRHLYARGVLLYGVPKQ